MKKFKYGLIVVIGCVFGFIHAYNITLDVVAKVNDIGMPIDKHIALPLSATISGTTAVCINDTPAPQITFTGADGTRPYTFEYTINGGATQTITTVGSNNAISVNVNTTTAGVFAYELLSVSDAIGTTTEAGTATVTVGNPPIVDFVFNNNGECSGTPVNFTSNITGSGPFIYEWQFGDGTISSLANPTTIYDALGCGFSNFTATLTVTDSNGCSASHSEIVNVEQRPNLSFVDLDAAFTPPFDNCGNNTVDPAYTINVGNTSVTSCITSYDINWGDGNSETNVSFPLTHTYAVLGSFNMEITGYGDSGCVATETILVKNSSNPIGSIISPGNTVNLCLPINQLGFQIGSWGPNPPDTVYFIDYGDGVQNTVTQDDLIAASSNYDPNNPAAADPFPIPHEYTESSCPNSSYTVTLIISTSCGETILTAGPIIILKKPEVDFDYENPGCVDTAVQFTNLTEGGFGPNCIEQTAHLWDFGDGTTSTLENPTHIYTAPGTYTVTLTEENFCGITEPVVKTICIEPDLAPSFSLNTNTGCVPLAILTTNTTDLTQSCGAETYLWEVNYTPEFCGVAESWSFTNGTDETSENPSFQFNNAGSYDITMRVSNACGEFLTSQTIAVKQPPNATMAPIDDACGAIAFNPIATVETCALAVDAITYSWAFPGGTPANSNQLDPGTINYTAVGDYTLSFSVTNACGTTTVNESFSINELPSITNTNLSETLCSGATSSEINLTADPSTATFSWSSNNPANLSGYVASDTSNSIPAQTLINTSASPVTLIYTVTPEINGCFGSPVNFEIIVEPAPVITTQPLSNSVCENGTADALSLILQGTGTPNYQWYVNTVDNTNSGTLITGATSATYTPPTDTVGILYYYVVISFSTGDCSEIISDTAAIEVTNTTQIDTQPLDTQSLCVGGQAQGLSIAVSGGAGVATYQWFSNTINSNTGGTLIPGANAATYTPPIATTAGTFYYYIEVNYTASGCSALLSNVSEIIVVDDPEITSEPLAFQSVCQNTQTQDLEVAVSGGLGNLSYQWFVTTVPNNTSGTLIIGATASVYTPPATAVGSLYYYCIITQDVSGCEVTSAVSTVEISAGAQFSIQPISDQLCLGDSTAALTVAYTNGTGTPTYQWFQNIINDTATGTAIGGATTATYNPIVDTVGTLYYYATITFNTGGCSEIISNTAEITVNPTPSLSDASILICSGNTFEFIPDPSDTVPSNTLYTWSNPVVSPAGSITGATAQTTPTAIVSQFLENTTTNPATLTYTVTPISGPCEGEDFTLEVTVNPSISVAATPVNNTCFQSNSASITIDIVGGVPFTTGNPYTILWTGPNGYSSTAEDISNLEAGSYTLVIGDDGGCPYTETFSITEPEDLVFNAVDFNPESISCFGANDGSIGIDVIGGTAPYTFSWTLDGAPFSNDEDVTNLGPGAYSISVTDANNCGPISLSFILEEPEVLEVTLETKTDVLCFGDATGAIAINTDGGRLNYSFVWTGPNGFSSTNANITDLFAGLYNLSVTDNSGCVDTLEVEILQNQQLNLELTITEIICYGDNNASITIDTILGGIPPYQVSWSNFGTGNSQMNLSADTYTISITDAEGCERDFPIVIEEAPLFLIDPVVNQMSCSGENDANIALNFVGGLAPVSVVWDDDPTAGTTRNNLAPGTYNVTITDGTPCVIQDSFTIFDIAPLQLSANLSDALDCADANSGAINLIIEGGTPPFNVLWSNGSTTEDLENVPPNTYVASVTDANGCEIEGTYTINRFEPLIVSVNTQTEVNCEERTVDQTFVAMASGGVPPFQYTWSSGTVTGANNEVMTTIEGGLVILEVVDGLGCSANYSLNVETPVLGDADFSTSSFGFLNFGIYTIQDPIEFTNTATGNYQSIVWDFGDGSFSAEENPVHTYVQVGSYVVTQTVTYPFGCVYTRVITLTIEEGYKLIMPNAFTPNDDGLNDFFAPVQRGLNTLEISIYDTWGSLIYKESGDALKGWDGKVKDELAENGNYFFTFSAKTFYGETIKKQGAFVYIK